MIIKIVTISLMAVFYICYFAKLISQKNAGYNLPVHFINGILKP